MTESIILARKPLGGTVVKNVLAHGTGAINVDATRTGHASAEDLAESQSKNPGRDDRATSDVYGADRPQQSVNASGRWPANVLLSHAPILDEFGWPVGDACAGGCVPGCAVAELDGQSGVTRDGVAVKRNGTATGGLYEGGFGAITGADQGYRGQGGASRFFPTFRYQAVGPVTETRDDMTDEAAPPTVTLYPGDCLAVLATLPDESISAVITDPPYGLSDLKPAAVVTAMTAWANGDRDHVPDGRGFMGRDWDAFVPPPAVWDECFRVLKPGGHLAAFAGSRTQDLMGLSIRMAGFEIRDGLQWLMGSGFPKGLDVGKAIDKAAGAEREVAGPARFSGRGRTGSPGGEGAAAFQGATGHPAEYHDTAPATDAARQWQGWNTALKPSVEPIILARRPLSGTVAANVLAHGTGAINVDATRVGTGDGDDHQRQRQGGGGAFRFDGFSTLAELESAAERGEVTPSGRDARTTLARVGWNPDTPVASGRWPALSHAPLLDEHGEPVGDACADGCVQGCPVAELDGQSGVTKSTAHSRGNGIGDGYHGSAAEWVGVRGTSDEGGVSRFFPSFRYQAKAPKAERPTIDGKGWPTVKPLGLMQWLARLLCPPGGVVLDPFPGTGTTGQAAQREGFESILIERDPFARDLVAVRIPDVVLGSVPAEPEPAPEPVEDAGDLVAASLHAATDVAELHAIRDAVPAEAWHADFDEIVAARAVELDPVLSAIATASSGAELRAVHIEHLSAWSDEYTAALVARVNELAAVQETVA